MKEATGELNMTVITIIAIGAIVAFFWVMWPQIQKTITNVWNGIDSGAEDSCPEGTYWTGSECRDAHDIDG